MNPGAVKHRPRALRHLSGLGVVKYLAQGLLKRPLKASEVEMRRFAEAWRPYRGLALVYAYAELDRRKRLKP